MSDTPITAAYQKFMRDLAKALTNDTTMIEQDVTDIYEFEKNLAKVVLSFDLFTRGNELF